MAKTKAREIAVKPRTLLIKGSEGEFKVTIPAGARVTFGPTIPFEPKGGGFQERVRGYSLRVYETAKNDSLIAVFANVESFRDITMPHAKLIVREAGKSMWKSDETGYETTTSVDRKRGFVDSARLLSE